MHGGPARGIGGIVAVKRGAASIKAICEAIWRIEKDLDLLGRTVGGVHYWPLVRLAVCYLAAQRLGIYGDPHPVATRSAAGRVAEYLSHLVTDAGSFPFRFRAPVDSILVPTSRKSIRDGLAIDIHCHRVLNEAAFGRFLVLDYPGRLGMYEEAPSRQVRSIRVLATLAQILGRSSYGRHLRETRREFAELDAHMRRELGLEFPISAAALASRVAIFAQHRSLLRRLFHKAKATRLFIVNSYGNPVVAAAGADAGVSVCELQHGVITPFHLGYSYPGRPIVPYAPKHLLVFGQFWAENTELPGNTTPLVIGSDNIAHYRAREIPRVRKRAIVLSQGAIGARLFEAAVTAARAAPEWEFIFRLHPNEDARAYRKQLLQSPSANIRISAPQDDFFELLASADVQIGVFSTGLFEGMALGARTIVLPLPGIEYMRSAIERGDAVLADDAHAIAGLLDKAPLAREPEYYYAPPVPSISSILEAR
jgi:hypothetical protein